jgi:purine-nucleoside phosphorylase
MHEESLARAKAAARVIRHELRLNADDRFPIGLQLGTGWGDVLTWEKEIPFSSLPGFESLGELHRHARRLAIGTVGDQRVLALRGRVHINEAPADPRIYAMVRLQIEMLQELGMNTLIATCAAGSLNCDLRVGDIVAVEAFITGFAPDMPGYVGEFESPEDTLKEELIVAAQSVSIPGLRICRGTHLMVRGPFFEGRKRDKGLYSAFGGDVIGMSLLPEACIMSLRHGRTLGLCFVSNDMVEVHDDAVISARVREKSALLSDFLRQTVAAIK